MSRGLSGGTRHNATVSAPGGFRIADPRENGPATRGGPHRSQNAGIRPANQFSLDGSGFSRACFPAGGAMPLTTPGARLTYLIIDSRPWHSLISTLWCPALRHLNTTPMEGQRPATGGANSQVFPDHLHYIAHAGEKVNPSPPKRQSPDPVQDKSDTQTSRSLRCFPCCAGPACGRMP